MQNHYLNQNPKGIAMILIRNAGIYLKALFLFFLVLDNSTQLALADSNKTSGSQLQHHTFKSSLLARQTKLTVRTPDSYLSSSRNYPVIYVLNASGFYRGDIQQHTIQEIGRLESVQQIPETIVVSINSQRWYQDVTERSAVFNQYINDEVFDYIQKKYRVLNKSAIVGHSYAAAFLSARYWTGVKGAPAIYAISPIYPNIDFLASSKEIFSNRNYSIDQLTIIQGEESTSDLKILQQLYYSSSNKEQKFNHRRIALEDHHSVYLPALNYMLKQFYRDYSEPGYQQIISQRWNYQQLEAFLAQRNKRYQLAFEPNELDSLTTAFAQTYLDAKEFALAFEFWDKSKSRFKSYFLNRAADRFWQLNEASAAINTLEKAKAYFPQSPLIYEKLSLWYLTENKENLADKNKREVARLIASINPQSSQSVFNQLGYYFIQKKRLDEASVLFIKLTDNFPLSANAFDNLGYSYETKRAYSQAADAYLKAVQLSQKTQSDQLNTYKSNYQRMLTALQSN